MYDHKLHIGRKDFCCYCLQAFSTKEIFRCHINDCFKKDEDVKFMNYEKKTKSPFIIYADFERFLKSYTNKYQEHVPCSYSYKLVRVDVKFSNLFNSFLGEDFVYNFINSMVKESKYCSGVMRKHFNEVLVMTKIDVEF